MHFLVVLTTLWSTTCWVEWDEEDDEDPPEVWVEEWVSVVDSPAAPSPE